VQPFVAIALEEAVENSSRQAPIIQSAAAVSSSAGANGLLQVGVTTTVGGGVITTHSTGFVGVTTDSAVDGGNVIVTTSQEDQTLPGMPLMPAPGAPPRMPASSIPAPATPVMPVPAPINQKPGKVQLDMHDAWFAEQELLAGQLDEQVPIDAVGMYDGNNVGDPAVLAGLAIFLGSYWRAHAEESEERSSAPQF
jgi:hypothetical protein